MKRMSLLDQHCYCILSLFREGVSLAFAVNIIAVPLTLFYFHKFPLLSLLFNLFIPFLVSCSMFLVLVAAIFHLLTPPFGDLLFTLATNFTHFMLNFIYNTPASLNIFWHVTEIPTYLLMIYLVTIFLAGAFFNEKLAKEQRIEAALLI